MDDAARLLAADADARSIFLAEARQRLAECARVLAGEFPRGGSAGAWTIYRHAHSLKGTAGAFGFERLEALAREVNDALAPLERDGVALSSEDEARVRRSFAEMARALS